MSELQRSVTVHRKTGSQQAAAGGQAYQWSLSYIRSTMEDLRRLESRAAAENDKEFLRKVRASMNNAAEAEKEIRARLEDY